MWFSHRELQTHRPTDAMRPWAVRPSAPGGLLPQRAHEEFPFVPSGRALERRRRDEGVLWLVFLCCCGWWWECAEFFLEGNSMADLFTCLKIHWRVCLIQQGQLETCRDPKRCRLRHFELGMNQIKWVWIPIRGVIGLSSVDFFDYMPLQGIDKESQADWKEVKPH